MAKKIVQDVVPPEARRSIRNISLSEVRPKSRERVVEEVPEIKKPRPKERVAPVDEIPSSESLPPRRRSIPSWSLWTIAILCILILAFALSFFFVTARINITVKHTVRDIDQTISLPYNTLSLDQEGSKEVKALGEEKVSLKASGSVVVFNNYSSASQTLIKNTRLETGTGLIFRTQTQVIVPGRTTKNDEIVPGSVKVAVVAEEAGDKYNVGLTDFIVSAFKNTPREKGFYGRSDIKIDGGFLGTRKKVNASDLSSAKAEIESKLRVELLSAAKAQVPQGSTVYDGLTTVTFSDLPQGTSGSDTTIIREKGTINALVLSDISLSDSIMKALIPSETGVIDIPNLKELKVVKKTQDEKLVSVMITGSPQFVWIFDENALRADLTGKPKSDLKTVLSKYGAVERAEVVIRPFWVVSFPKNADKITVTRAPID